MKPTDSMYQGKKPFSREQLFFVVEAILTAVTDRVETILPTSSFRWKDYKKFRDENYADSWIAASLETAGMAIAILYAQLNDDGIGIGAALVVADNFQDQVNNWVNDAWKNKGKNVKDQIEKLQAKTPHFSIRKCYTNWPNERQAAETFVNQLWPVKKL